MAPAVRIENLSKLYRIGARQQAHYRTLRESLMDAAAAPWRRWQTLRNQSRVAAHELNGQAADCPNSVKLAEHGTDRRLVGTVPITLSTNAQAATNGRALSNGQAALNGHAPTSRQPATSSLPPAPLIAPPDTIWALNDVSFDVQHGEVVGIIGRNGAGKSTLLKILSRITEPTSGRVVLNGRVASLLEVGTGFHPELTGRENIYLNGAILGMHRHEIKRKFDAIVDFSGIDQFFDTPVKRYSSGMYVRLAFAVAAHLDPEILIIDEVLAVGDAEFQKKCLGKMHDIARCGRTVLFVSHNMAAVANLCEHGVVMDRGRVIWKGDADSALVQYHRLGKNNDKPGTTLCSRSSVFHSIQLEDAHGEMTSTFRTGEELVVVLDMTLGTSVMSPVFGINIETSTGEKLFTISNLFTGPIFKSLPGNTRVRCRIPRIPLVEGIYSIRLGFDSQNGHSERIPNAIDFEIARSDYFGTGGMPTSTHGHFVLDSEWRVDKEILA